MREGRQREVVQGEKERGLDEAMSGVPNEE